MKSFLTKAATIFKLLLKDNSRSTFVATQKKSTNSATIFDERDYRYSIAKIKKYSDEGNQYKARPRQVGYNECLAALKESTNLANKIINHRLLIPQDKLFLAQVYADYAKLLRLTVPLNTQKRKVIINKSLALNSDNKLAQELKQDMTPCDEQQVVPHP